MTPLQHILLKVKINKIGFILSLTFLWFFNFFYLKYYYYYYIIIHIAWQVSLLTEHNHFSGPMKQNSMFVE